ncbi:MAG: beta-eliminating lyase-related protein, partial [Ktedonobacterales bacterium]
MDTQTDTQQAVSLGEQAAAPDASEQPAATPADAAMLRRTAFLQCERTLNGHPPQSMRAELLALAESVGPDEQPDRYGGGALIEAFEREIAELLGKEAAVFMPSGTMAQQIALRTWSARSGRTTVAFHPTCHLEIHENKGYERLHGLHATLVGDAERVITLDDLRATPEPLAALLLE